MFLFALKNMATKKVQLILVTVSILLSCGVSLVSYNTAEQVSDGITGNAQYYSAIIGPSGSETQLAMNTMYFSDEPLGTIPYSLVGELQKDTRVTAVIPFAMADSYNGYNIVGTTPLYLEKKTIADGKMFDSDGVYQVVVGATVAKRCSLSVGDVIYTSHSAGETHTQPFTVVGILQQTNSSFDRVVFTQLKTIWAVHEAEEEEGEEEHDHEEMNNMVCAILVKTKNPAYAITLVNDYDGRVSSYEDEDGDVVTYSLQAIEPMSAVRSVLEDTDQTKYIVYILCGIVLILNILVISVITLLNTLQSAKEIKLMRLIGIRRRKIEGLYLLENGILGMISALFAFVLSRLCLYLMSDYVADMGVVLDFGKIYPMEWVILAGVVVLCILPTLVCTKVLAGREAGKN